MIDKTINLILKILNDTVYASLMHGLSMIIYKINSVIELIIRMIIVILITIILLPFISLYRLIKRFNFITIRIRNYHEYKEI